MDLRLVEIFCRVLRERSFSRAAAALGVTQPTVSAHIKELEQSLGTPLFNRLGRDIEPTEAGRFLYARAEPLLTLRRELAEQMAGFLNRVEGALVIGASSVPGEHLLPGLVAAFHADHPAIRAALRVSDSARVIAEVRNGTVELGVVGATTKEEDLEFQVLAADELVLALPATGKWPKGQELALEQVRRLPLLVREEGSGTRSALQRALASRHLELGDFSIAAELGSTGAVREAVRAGHGVSFVSSLSLGPRPAALGLRLARIRELGSVRREYHTVVSRRRVLAPSARAFLEYIRDSTPGAARPGARRRR